MTNDSVVQQDDTQNENMWVADNPKPSDVRADNPRSSVENRDSEAESIEAESSESEGKYRSFESLLLTNRVAKRMGRNKTWLRVCMAGWNPKNLYIEFNNKKDAQTCGNSLLHWIREKRADGEIRTDLNYNQTIGSWLAEIERQDLVKKDKSEERNGKQISTGE